MRERAEELKQRVRETPLNDRLDDARRRIGKMCSEGRPPRMTIPVQYDDDDFYISTTLSDAQATIADLQGQVTKWQEIASLRFAGDHKFVKEMELLKVENSALRQRVAQLEAALERVANIPVDGDGRDYYWEGRDIAKQAIGRPTSERYTTLQADHARVLGLVRALPKFECELYVMSWPSGQAAVYQRNQENKAWHCESREHAEALKCLLEYRASLPTQPEQGGE